MAGNTTKIIVVAQAEGDALQDGVIVDENGAPFVEEGAVAIELEPADGYADVFPPFDSAHFGSQLLWLALTFVFLYVVMSRIALPRIGGILETRRTRIEGDLKEAERLRVETERALAAYEAALAEARQNAHAIAEETRSSIKADIDNKRTMVEGDLSARVAEAEARIQVTKTSALGNVDAIAAETAQALVARLIGSVTAKQARDAVALVVKE
jgi:F-type H+-transporting ATPase subunit b